MNPIRRLLETVHLTFAGLWLGSLAMTGVAAAVIFPTLRDLDPHLASHADFTGEHWLLAAGQVAAKIFFISDAVQLGCIIICGLTLGAIVLTAEAWRRPFATGFRLISIFGAISMLSYSFVFLGPRMNVNMAQYWTAAAAGQNEEAAKYQAAFDEDHPKATRVMLGSFMCALLLISSGTMAAVGAPPPAKRGQEPKQSRLQPPELLRGRPKL